MLFRYEIVPFYDEGDYDSPPWTGFEWTAQEITPEDLDNPSEEIFRNRFGVPMSNPHTVRDMLEHQRQSFGAHELREVLLPNPRGRAKTVEKAHKEIERGAKKYARQVEKLEARYGKGAVHAGIVEV